MVDRERNGTVSWIEEVEVDVRYRILESRYEIGNESRVLPHPMIPH